MRGRLLFRASGGVVLMINKTKMLDVAPMQWYIPRKRVRSVDEIEKSQNRPGRPQIPYEGKKATIRGRFTCLGIRRRAGEGTTVNTGTT